MSLFGTSPDDQPTPVRREFNSKSSLFSDEPSFGASSSLFADDSLPIETSPAPKRAARRDLVKQLLPASDVPESYIDAYDALLRSTDGSGAGIDVNMAKDLLASTGLDAEQQDTILNIVRPAGRSTTEELGRGEFNVLLALVGLGQEREDLTLDSVDERRKSKLFGILALLFHSCSHSPSLRTAEAEDTISGETKLPNPRQRPGNPSFFVASRAEHATVADSAPCNAP
jgi:sorting nexin-8